MIFQPVVLAVIERDRKFLLTLRNHYEDPTSIFHNKWQLPGGKLEFNEGPEEAIVREIREELSVKVKVLSLIPKIYHRVRETRQFIFICYVCRIDPKAKIVLNEEASKYEWFTFDQVKSLDFLPLTDEVIAYAIANYDELFRSE